MFVNSHYELSQVKMKKIQSIYRAHDMSGGRQIFQLLAELNVLAC